MCTVALEAGDTCKIHGASLFMAFSFFFFKFLFPACLVAPEADYSRKIDTIDSPWYSGLCFSLVCYFFNFCIVTVHGKVALEAAYARKIDSPHHSGSLFYFLFSYLSLFLCIV